MPATRRRPRRARRRSARRLLQHQLPNPTQPRRPSRPRRKTVIPSSRRFGASAYLASVSPQGVSFPPPPVTRSEGVERALGPDPRSYARSALLSRVVALAPPLGRRYNG